MEFPVPYVIQQIRILTDLIAENPDIKLGARTTLEWIRENESGTSVADAQMCLLSPLTLIWRIAQGSFSCLRHPEAPRLDRLQAKAAALLDLINSPCTEAEVVDWSVRSVADRAEPGMQHPPGLAKPARRREAPQIQTVIALLHSFNRSKELELRTAISAAIAVAMKDAETQKLVDNHPELRTAARASSQSGSIQ